MDDQAPPPVLDENAKYLLAMDREDQRRTFDRYDKIWDFLNESAVKAGDGALRSGLLINGGAAVSVLAFIGSLVNRDMIKVGQLNQVAGSLTLFAFGVALAVAGMGFSYVTHFLGAGRVQSFERTNVRPFLGEGKNTRRYTYALYAFHVIAFLSGLGCIGLFIAGMLSVRNAIGHLGG